MLLAFAETQKTAKMPKFYFEIGNYMSDTSIPTCDLYDYFDPDNLDAANVTLCVDCAKHPSLKESVKLHSVEGPVCGVCQEVGYIYPACDPAKKEDLTNLIKALIRFYYNEHDYNPHWGGESEPEGLLTTENPIIETEPHAGRLRTPEKAFDFFYALLTASPYPPVESGISVYAGFYEGARLLHFAMNDSLSFLLRRFLERLESSNYFDIEPDLLTLLEELSDRLTNIIPAGTRYYRARVGVEATYSDHSISSWRSPLLRKPFSGAALGAPPPQIATAGRLNRAGVSFLYLASDEATAAAEVRPHPGHYLSIGQFESKKDLKIASFEADIIHFFRNEHQLDLFHFIHSVDERMAMPVIPGNSTRYSITQLIAECLRQRGFDGISFKSSVGNGTNVCVFRPDLLLPVEESATVKKVRSLKYGLEDSPTVLETDANLYLHEYR